MYLKQNKIYYRKRRRERLDQNRYGIIPYLAPSPACRQISPIQLSNCHGDTAFVVYQVAAISGDSITNLLSDRGVSQPLDGSFVDSNDNSHLPSG